MAAVRVRLLFSAPRFSRAQLTPPKSSSPSIPNPSRKPYLPSKRTAADTRRNDAIGLGLALLQHHHSGVLPSVASFRGPLPALPLSDPLAATSMPEAWVRGAILVRINSLIRGHSAVRWELLEKMAALLHEDITPCVPLRGSVSASGGMFVTFVPPTSHDSCLVLFLYLIQRSRSHSVGLCCRGRRWHP